MTFFVTQVKLAGERIDINLVSETILIPLFVEVYGYEALENLNRTEGENYPGIDLGDKVARVAVQVTAKANSEKVKDTLRTFVKYRLYDQYDRLIIYILTEKQQSYSGKGYQEITRGKFVFDKDTDILDASDVLRQINGFQIDKARRIKQFLEANFGDGTVPWYQEPKRVGAEAVYLNLLELFFPEEVYVADIDIDRDKVVNNSRGREVRVSKRSSPRNIVRAALEQRGWGFGVDWVCHEGKIITFHDLTDFNIPLSGVVDAGTVTPLGSNEFYEVDESYARVFKHLLRRCMQQKLYHQGVSWQNEEKLYIFVDEDGENKRTEEWYDRRTSKRTVYECTMQSQEPDKIWYCKHLAFRTEFQRLGTQWYVLIKPEWFFSYNGYKKSFYSAEKVKWLKRREINMHVFNHVRFIAYFLKYGKPSDFFIQRPVYPFLEFGELLSFDSAPVLDDKAWLRSEPKAKSDSVLPLFEDL
jgi:hypothetical protein